MQQVKSRQRLAWCAEGGWKRTDLTGEAALDLVERLELRDRDEDDDRLLAALDVDLAGSRDLEGAELGLKVGNVVLEVEERLGDQGLGGVRRGARRVGSPEDLLVWVVVVNLLNTKGADERETDLGGNGLKVWEGEESTRGQLARSSTAGVTTAQMLQCGLQSTRRQAETRRESRERVASGFDPLSSTREQRVLAPARLAACSACLSTPTRPCTP